MFLTKNIYLCIPASQAICKIVEDNLGDSNAVCDLLVEFEKTLIDNVVCDLVYHRVNNGPKMIEKHLGKIADVATARLVSVALQQSNKEPIVSDGRILFDIDTIELIKSFRSLPAFCTNMSSCVLDNIQDNGEVPEFNCDDMLIILHAALVSTLDETDFYLKAKEFATATANLADLQKAIDNIENATKLLAAKCTYLYIAKAIENTSLWKSNTSKLNGES